jgi:CRISP-associated protein Cas1
MNKIYDFLVSDKEPFVYVEKTKIVVDDGFFTLLSGEDGKKILAPSSHLVLMLGAGTSITQEAAILASQHDMHISFVRGGSNIHSFFMEGRYQDPIRLVNQIKNQESFKLEIAKKLLNIRFQLLNLNYQEDINKITKIDELILYEARWTKSVYKNFCIKYKINDFKRNFDSTDKINSNLNILNNVLYSLCSAISLSCHLSPSISFIHGYSRRGGLAFDLADLIKTSTIVETSFKETDKNVRQLIYQLMTKLKENNNKLFKLMIKICLILGEPYNEENWEKLYVDYNFK